jgi:hypothetical protein
MRSLSAAIDGVPWQLGCNHHIRRSLTDYFTFRVLLVAVGKGFVINFISLLKQVILTRGAITNGNAIVARFDDR